MQTKKEAYVVAGALVVPMPRELDHHSSEEIHDNLELMLAGRGVRRVVLDFSETEFMDSAGIGMILGKYKRVKAFGGQVAVCGVSDRIMRIMAMSGICKIIPVYATAHQAVSGKQ